MTPQACLNYFRASERHMLEALDALVSIDSPSGDIDGITSFVRKYSDLLHSAGIRLMELPGPGGPHLLGEGIFGGSSGPPIVLVGHSDTVWPRGEAARRPPTRSEGRLYGPGACDMRAGLVIAAFALRCLRESRATLCRPVQIFLSADEEVGSLTAHPHMERLFSPDTTALVLEPPLEDGSLKIARKGVGMYRLTAQGIEAHAGLEPEKGASAITEIVHQILEVLSWADPARGITLNIGQIRGGFATNVVAGHAEAGLDVRFDTLADGKAIHARLQELRPLKDRTRLRIEGGIIFPPLVPDDRSYRLAGTAMGIARELGLEISTGKAGGGSDGSFLASRGVCVLDGVGVDGAGAHTPQEHIRIDRLALRAALLTLLVLAEGTGD